MEKTLTNTHYYIDQQSPSYAVFNSRWDEFLLVDKTSKRSMYAYAELGVELHALFVEYAAIPDNYHTFNLAAAEYVQEAGENVRLTSDVMRQLC